MKWHKDSPLANMRVNTHPHMPSTVLRYPGGKSRAVKHILPRLPEADVYISPFFGGGAIELALAAQGKRVIANDKFEPLYNFWQCLQEDADAVEHEVRRLQPFTKEKFHDCRSKILDQTIEPVRRAAMYFAINRSSFSGATLSGGYSKAAAETRFNDAAIERLRSIDLSNIEFHNMDFKDFLLDYGHLGVIYLDPPYLLASNKLYGTAGDMHEHFPHASLCEMLQRNPEWKWVLSYNDTQEIRTMYASFRMETAAWSYGMNKTKQSSELLIFPR
jgi:DNA adenine methylase